MITLHQQITRIIIGIALILIALVGQVSAQDSTATDTPTIPTATNTLVPPTATSTPTIPTATNIPPTATNTLAPPTATSVPATPTDSGMLTATIKFSVVVFWDGPGNSDCYNNLGALYRDETVTLLGYTPTVCHPYPNHISYFVQTANGTQGWIIDSALNLPAGVDSLPILSPPATNTPVPPTATSSPTNTSVPPTATYTPTIPTATNTSVPPTATSTPTIPTATNIPPTATNTPVPTILEMQLQVTTDNNQQSQFRYRLKNISAQSQSNLSVRFYFTIDNSNVATNYKLEKYWDQSGSAVISGPTLENGDTYYYTITYAGTLSSGNTWEYAGGFHLNNWASTYNSGNDFWISGGSSSSYIATDTLPIYQNGTLALGNTP